MKASNKAIELIKKWETLRLKSYDDGAGTLTIGWGHTKTASLRTEITKELAEDLLMQDISIYEVYINHQGIKLRQCQFDALISLIFNVGSIYDTRLLKLLKSNPDSKNVSDEWIEFRKSGGKYMRGLLRRRIDELSLYYSW